jgi:hypothetical protein
MMRRKMQVMRYIEYKSSLQHFNSFNKNKAPKTARITTITVQKALESLDMRLVVLSEDEAQLQVVFQEAEYCLAKMESWDGGAWCYVLGAYYYWFVSAF